MKWISSILVVALLVPVVHVPCAAAKGPNSGSVLVPGAQVRIVAPAVSERRLAGTFVSLSADSLFINPGRTRSQLGIPRASVTRLDVRSGRGYRIKKYAVRCGTVGLVLGAFLGVMLWDNGDPWTGQDLGPEQIFAGALSLGTIGLLLGAGIGAAIGDYWTEVRLNRPGLGVTPQRQGGLGLFASITF